MAEKEERILIARSTDYTITDTAEGALFDANIAPHCANVFTRQEAIERIAKALCLCDDDGGCKGICNPKCEVWKYSLNHAESALNALLGKE